MKLDGKNVLIFFALLIGLQSEAFSQNSLADLSKASAEAIERFQTQPNQINLAAAQKIGFALTSNGQFVEAEQFFDLILKKNPADGLSLYGVAVARFNLKNYSGAAESLTKSSAIFEKQKNKTALADNLVLSAVISAVTGDNDSAIEKLKKAVAFAPTNFDANFSLGRAYFGNGDLPSAIAAFRAALKQQPQNVKANFFLATALERSGETASAIESYRQLIKIAPTVADGYLGLGVLLVKTDGNSSVEAFVNLNKAIAINENLYEAQVALGKILFQQNKLSDALIHLQKAIALAPHNPEPHYQIMQVYRRLGKKAEADEEQAIIKKIHESHRGSTVAPQN